MDLVHRGDRCQLIQGIRLSDLIYEATQGKEAKLGHKYHRLRVAELNISASNLRLQDA